MKPANGWEPGIIYKQMNEVMKEVSAIGKTEKNAQQGFHFRGIDEVLNAVGPAFRKHGIVAVPHVNEYQYETVAVGRNQTQMAHVQVEVHYTFYAADGSNLHAGVVAEAMDSGDKAMAKAMSVAYRTALLQVLCIPTDEPDPDSFSYERSAVDKPQKPAKAPKPSEEPDHNVSAGLSKSQRMVLERVLAKSGTDLAVATHTHLGEVKTWQTVTVDDLSKLLPALAKEQADE